MFYVGAALFPKDDNLLHMPHTPAAIEYLINHPHDATIVDNKDAAITLFMSMVRDCEEDMGIDENDPTYLLTERVENGISQSGGFFVSMGVADNDDQLFQLFVFTKPPSMQMH